MSNLISAMSNAQNRSARTENGAVTLASSKSALLDFFSTAGAYRTRTDNEVIDAFSLAFSESRELAMRALFYLRDCRGGQGERRLFRVIWTWLIKNYPKIAQANLENVPFYGRWDDLFWDSTSLSFSASIIEAVKRHYMDDLKLTYEQLSLFKWLPSINTSSKATVAKAKAFLKYFNMTPRDYRKMLSSAREKLGIVEREMSARRWEGITFSKVPSKASLLYRKAFWKHTPDLYEQYLAKVEKGEEKINAGVTYPYEIVREYLTNKSNNDRTLNAAWEALPDYIKEGEKFLVMADVSGSMMNPGGLPMAVSISLALYAAERNKDLVFGGHFMTFSTHPELVKVKGANLFERVRNLSQASWSMSTNLQSAFDMILRAAVSNKLPAEELPTKLFIITDMNWNVACSSNNRTNLEVIKKKYIDSGYTIPQLVFWNVNSTSNQSPCSFDEEGVFLVSGCSPSIFKAVMTSKAITPYDMMIETLSSSRYDRITV